MFYAPGMSWIRGTSAVLAVCALALTGTTGCAAGDGRVRGASTASPTPAGKLLRGTDKEGRHFREVPEEGAPEVGIEVQPDADDAWSVRLTVRRFRFSPAGTRARAVPGQGFAFLFVDDRLVTRLRGVTYRIPARLVPRGTHHVTARLYADDGTAWAVAGEPVQSTADITASDVAPDARTTARARTAPDLPQTSRARTAPGTRAPLGASAAPVTVARSLAPRAGFTPGTPNVASALSEGGTDPRTGRRRSPAPAGKAS